MDNDDRKHKPESTNNLEHKAAEGIHDAGLPLFLNTEISKQQ